MLEEETYQKLRQRVEERCPITCGGSPCACESASPTGGMVTNGGCLCEPREIRRALWWWRRTAIVARTDIVELLDDLQRKDAEIARLTDHVAELRAYAPGAREQELTVGAHELLSALAETDSEEASEAVVWWIDDFATYLKMATVDGAEVMVMDRSRPSPPARRYGEALRTLSELSGWSWEDDTAPSSRPS